MLENTIDNTKKAVDAAKGSIDRAKKKLDGHVSKRSASGRLSAHADPRAAEDIMVTERGSHFDDDPAGFVYSAARPGAHGSRPQRR